MGYVFLQCRDEMCRLRFPAPAAEANGLPCPRCRGETQEGRRGEGDVESAEKNEGLFSVSSAPALRPPHPSLIALLDNIRSIHNVGSMFRTADGAGVDHLHLLGITATPDHPRLAKAALGAHETVGWTHHRHGPDAAARLRESGFRLWALERTAEPSPQLSLYEAELPAGPLALIVGNERAGVDPGLLALCDGIFALPMSGVKSSLNVAVAFGIAVYHLRYGRERGGHGEKGALPVSSSPCSPRS
jgi:23S rRNA (guanosine2251-2'-O)-methyltransferase